MKIVQKTFYECGICGKEYSDENEVKRCEAKPITQDKGVKVGDIVMIKAGDGVGHKAKVTRRFIIDQDWGHYFPERYHHTVALMADVIGSWGSRQLTWDDYEII